MLQKPDRTLLGISGDRMNKITGVSVVIPNYNGADLLRENLPSVLDALEQWGGENEVIVVDDCSKDDSAAVVRDLFPAIRLLVNEENLGFSRTCNRGMAIVRYPVVFCINTDVRVEPDLVAPVLRHFVDESVFAVTPNILAEREGRNQGIVTSLYGKGFMKGCFAPIGEKSEVRENLYAIGACVAYRMDKFRALGGYNEIFTPYLFEDVDISYRAWKQGWRSLYEPGATVHHFNSATIEKSGKWKKRTVYFRNRFLFHWLNLTDRPFVLRNIIHTVLRLAVSFLWFDIPYYRAFCGALRRFGQVVRLRREMKSHCILSDRDILRRTAGGAR